MKSSTATRRQFLGTTGKAAAAAASFGTPRSGYCAEPGPLKVALVGCGGRGSGAAANALATKGPVQLWTMADVFENRLQGSLNALTAQRGTQVVVPPERRFTGFDAYRHAIDSIGAGGVVILATPPAFRPLHFEYAVAKGVHIFMEKSFAVDAPGIRRVLKAGEEAAKKNLKVATGLMSRHYLPLEEAVRRIHDGSIGEVINCRAYRMHAPLGTPARAAGQSELACQIQHYSNFTWLNGSFFVDWLIHNIDVCCWVKNDWPESAQGMGGRQVRSAPDQLFDHYSAEFTFPDGTRMDAQGRHMADCYGFFGDVIQGTKGSAVLGEGIPNPRLYKGFKQKSDSLLWSHNDEEPCDHYQREHDLLFDAIRNDRPWNEVERSAKSCLTAIMGRMAIESGKVITWEAALNSNLQLAPDLDALRTLDDPAPVSPDASGHYPVATPGRTVVL